MYSTTTMYYHVQLSCTVVEVNDLNSLYVVYIYTKFYKNNVYICNYLRLRNGTSHAVWSDWDTTVWSDWDITVWSDWDITVWSDWDITVWSDWDITVWSDWDITV